MLLSVGFIFLVLSAQFESFRQPFVVLVAVPFAICGALAGLAAWDGSLNAYSAIGLVALLGLIAKHGILITEFANQLREEGRPPREAVLDAAAQRLRAILMTTAGTVLGAVPLAVATGADAATRAEIGIVIVSGMTLGTLVSLFLVPALYLLFAPRRQAPATQLQPT
jgi:multidrug efflux pump